MEIAAPASPVRRCSPNVGTQYRLPSLSATRMSLNSVLLFSRLNAVKLPNVMEHGRVRFPNAIMPEQASAKEPKHPLPILGLRLEIGAFVFGRAYRERDSVVDRHRAQDIWTMRKSATSLRIRAPKSGS